jgi:predicted Zn-dependent protease
MRKLLFTALSIIACSSVTLSAENPADLSVQAAFKRGVALLGDHNEKEAIPYFERVRTELPSNGAVLWNLGMCLAKTSEHSRAEEVWRDFRKAEPNNWLGRKKLIQALQGQGTYAARDLEIKALYAFRESAAGAESLQPVTQASCLPPAGRTI